MRCWWVPRPQAAASGRLARPSCQVACVRSVREPVGRPWPSRVTAQRCLAGLPVAWPCHWGPGRVAAFAVSERTGGVLLTSAYCGPCGKQATRGNHALRGARSTSQPTGPPPHLRPAGPPHASEMSFQCESLPNSTSPPAVHVYGFLPSFLPCQGSSPLLTSLFRHFFIIYLLIP